MRHNYTRAPLADRFWPKVERSDGCWLWTGCVNESGYGRVGLGGKDGRSRGAHRIAYELTYGPIPDGLWVLHRCDTPRCCRPEHLYLGDVRRNARDMVERGRSTKGEKNPARLHPERIPRGEQRALAKLTDEAVRRIRMRRAAGEPLNTLAAEFGVSFQTISDVARRKVWAHVQ